MTPQTSTSTTSKSDSSTATQGINADHVLVKLTRERIAANWDVFRPAIRESLPPQVAVSNERMKNILQSLLAGRGNLWAYVFEDRIVGIVVTTKYQDNLSFSTSLLVYAIYAFEDISLGILENALETLKEYARSEGFDELIAFSQLEPVVRMFEEKGAEVSTRLIRFEL